MSHTGQRLGCNCKKHKGQLKMMEDEQNLKKNAGKGAQANMSKKCCQTTDRLENL